MAGSVRAADVPGFRQVVKNGRTGLLRRSPKGAILTDARRRLLVLGTAARAAIGTAGSARLVTGYDLSRRLNAGLEAIGRVGRAPRRPGPKALGTARLAVWSLAPGTVAVRIVVPRWAAVPG